MTKEMPKCSYMPYCSSYRAQRLMACRRPVWVGRISHVSRFSRCGGAALRCKQVECPAVRFVVPNIVRCCSGSGLRNAISDDKKV